MKGMIKVEKKTQNKIIIFILIIVCIIIACFAMLSKPKENTENDKTTQLDAFYGLWNIDDVTKYEFDGKGRGKMLLPESSLEYEFSYKVDDNEILIDFDSEEAKDFKYKYSIEENKIQLEGKTPGSSKIEIIREEK